MNTQNAMPEVDFHHTGLHDSYGRSIMYRTVVETVGDPDSEECRYRVTGHQLRNGRPHGRGSAPLTVRTPAEARTAAETLFQRHMRYVEQKVAVEHVKSLAKEEDRSLFQ